MDLVGEGKVQAMTFAYSNGVQIGPRDFAQVYVGDVNGPGPDDVVAVYEDGSVEVFLTVYNPASAFLARTRGIGFHSMGVVLPGGLARVTTVNFLGTLHGYGTNVEGEWDVVMRALRRCHETLHEMGAPRVSTNLRLGTRTDREQSLADKERSVLEKLGIPAGGEAAPKESTPAEPKPD